MMVESLVPALDGRLVTLFEGLGSLRGEDGLEGTKVAHANTVADLHVVDKAVDERVEHGLGLRRVHATRVAALLHQLGEGHLGEGSTPIFYKLLSKMKQSLAEKSLIVRRPFYHLR